MNSADIFRELRYWLETLDSSTAEVTLDQQLYGASAWRKNSATFINQMRMQNSAIEGLHLLREARQVVADDPRPSNVLALVECECLIHQYLARFDEPSTHPPAIH